MYEYLLLGLTNQVHAAVDASTTVSAVGNILDAGFGAFISIWTDAGLVAKIIIIGITIGLVFWALNKFRFGGRRRRGR